MVLFLQTLCTLPERMTEPEKNLNNLKVALSQINVIAVKKANEK